MPKSKKKKNQIEEVTDLNIDVFAEHLMQGINDEIGEQAVFNLGAGEAPIDVTRWITSGAEVFDWILSGRANGGYPDGRLVEISGPESIGKSHLAYQVAKNIQQMGGITLYIDTESASARDNLINLGIDITDKKFIFSQRDNIEAVFKVIESFIKNASAAKGNFPLCVIWDSVGGIGSIKDAEREYEDSQQPGVDAKAIKRGMRRLMNTVGYNRVLFIVINQQYTKIGAEKWEKKTITGGGAGIRYAATVRAEIIPFGGGRAFIFPNDLDPKEAVKQDIPPIGIRIKIKTIKNKIASPFRSCELEIHFGVGLKDHHQKWELLHDYSPILLSDGREVTIGNKAWKIISVLGKEEQKEKRPVILEDKFRKGDIRNKMEEHASLVTECINVIMAERMKTGGASALTPGPDFDPNSLSDVQALQDETKEIEDAFKDIE